MGPLVSIICLVYNHGKFVGETLNGFLMQDVNFDIEVVIHDDKSTDNSVDIINQYIKNNKNPRIHFKPIFQKVNQASLERGRVTRLCFNAAKGKYIAICEGDDYWTDPYKLQKQVDFLEENTDYMLSFHGVDYLKNGIFSSKEKFSENIFTQKDLAYKGCFINTPSVVFKNILKENPLPDWFNKLSTGDYALFLWLSNFGKINYFPETMAVYRQHDGGTWSVQKDLDMYTKITNNLAILYQQDFSNEVKEGFIQQNRNNLKFVLFELIANLDWDKINEIRELSNFDNGFDGFILDTIVRKHLDLKENSRFNKLKKTVKKLFYN